MEKGRSCPPSMGVRQPNSSVPIRLNGIIRQFFSIFFSLSEYLPHKKAWMAHRPDQSGELIFAAKPEGETQFFLVHHAGKMGFPILIHRIQIRHNFFPQHRDQIFLVSEVFPCFNSCFTSVIRYHHPFHNNAEKSPPDPAL